MAASRRGADLEEGTGTAASGSETAMRLRVLLSGLTFFAGALLLGWGPLAANAHPVDPWKPCTIRGTAGDDFMLGTAGPDVMCGLGGNDTMAASDGADILRGGTGNDRLEGGSGKDVMLGGKGRDWFAAYDGTHDHLNGGPGTDYGRGDRLVDLFKSIETGP
jgi:Ca2+-binding RTX toxin-like protein